jgi:protein-disulfide isomerase
MVQTKKSSVIPSVKLFRPTQQQVLYTILLAATFLIGYLLATVQLLKNPAGSTAQVQGEQQQAAAAAQAPAAPKVEDVLPKLTKSHLPIKGDENAKVTIVGFSDFECPFCANFYKDTLPQIQSEYIDKGLVKLDYRHYPLSFHPQAKPLGIASECANEQGMFWQMHDKIFDENVAGALSAASSDTYKKWAGEIGLDTGAFNSCYDAGRGGETVDADFALGNEVGVSGAPTFYINGRQLVGAQPFASFKAIIDEELKRATEG